MTKLPEGRSALTDEQMIGLTHRLVDTCIDCKGRIEELEANLSEQIEWVKQLADDLIAAEGREARLKEKLAKAVEEAEKYQHAFAAQSRKLQAVLHIEGVRTTLAELTGGKNG